MLSTCSAWRNALQTSQPLWLALLLARFPKIDLGHRTYAARTLRQSYRDTYRMMLDIERLRSAPACHQPPVNLGAKLSDFTFVFEGTLMPEPRQLCVGAKVVLTGLKSQPQYNGVEGEVIEQRGERWGVRLSSRLEKGKLVLPSNLSLRSECLRLVRGPDPMGRDDSWRGPTPFGSCQTWVGSLTESDLGGDGQQSAASYRSNTPRVFFGSVYDSEWSDAFTSLSVYVASPTTQMVKIYEGRDDEAFCPIGAGSGEMALAFESITLPLLEWENAKVEDRRKQEEADGCELRLKAVLDFGITLEIFDESCGETVPATSFLNFLRGEAVTRPESWNPL